MNKKAFLVGFLILLLVAIPATLFLVQRQQEIRSRAEPATTLNFEPLTKTVAINETFTINVAMNTGANSVSTAEIHLTFDPTKLEATQIAAGSFMPHAIVESTPDNTAGRAFIAVDTLSAGAGGDSVPFTKKSDGPQPVAAITFRAKAETGSTPTQVGFGQETKAFGETSGSLEPTSVIITSSLTNTARVTIGAAGATPTPTTGAGTPTPTPTGGATGNKPPVCNSLTASPATGTAPLTVTLTANGSDQNNDIMTALFTFGDGQTQNIDKNIGQTGSIQVTHVYQNPGTISAQAIMRDRDGAVSAACTASIALVAAGTPTPTIAVGGGATSPTATPSATPVPTTAAIPETADITPTTILGIAGAALVVIGAILLLAL